MLKSGGTKLNVYRSEFAGTNKATALTFDVDDIDAEVRELKDKGITFEHYDIQGLTPEGDVYRGEGMMIYGEDMAPTGLTYDDVTTKGDPNAKWAKLEEPLLRRAVNAFHVSER